MQFFTTNFRWVMLISGLLTCTMVLAFISPQASTKSNFGVVIEDAAANIIVRNWGALIGLMGIMLIYGALVKSVRRYSLIIAGVSKIIFIALVLTLGEAYLKFGVGTAVIIDSITVVLFIVYLLFSRSKK